MLRVLSLIVSALAGLHGLVHLMGFIAYWPLAALPDLPYKTSLLNGRLELGAGGMRFISVLWLLAGIGWVAAALLLAFGKPTWAPLMLAATLLSLLLCALDWSDAFRGFFVNLGFLVVLFVVFGLRVQPAPLPAYTGVQAYPAETIPLPAGLPEPVERFYQQAYPDGKLPVYHTAVLSGRGSLRIMGITFPARMRFVHLTGQGYRHYLEANFYGFPVMKVNEHFIDGHARLELPFGVTENEPTVDSAANQGLWAEMVNYPASYLSDAGARWEAVDENTARLYVPWQAGQQVFTVTFDPQTGKLVHMETMRYRDAKSGLILWTVGSEPLPGKGDLPASEIGTATWGDEGTPWLKLTLEEQVYNTDISAYILQKGP